MTIKNGDMPAMPVQECGPDGNPQFPACYGLTKREMFAMAAMQGILTRSAKPDRSAIANYAVKYADALLAELDKTK